VFIAGSKNKISGTSDIAEHRTSRFVVGAGNANTRGENSMTNRFMISVAAAALIAGTGFANAQGTGMSREGASGGSTVQQSAPSSGSSGTSTNRSGAESTSPPSGMKATQSEEKSPGAGKNQRAQDDMKAGQKEKSAQDNNMKGEKSAQDTMKGEKSKGMSSENEGAKGKDMKAEGREGRDTKTNAQGREDRNTAQGREGREDRNTAQGREDRMNGEKSGTSTTTTTGQAGAGAKLAPEQRTKITSVIREQHVQSINNVNFEIRPGVRVTRDVRFYPLPREVVEVYPQWRGYEFILVKDKIVVVDPRTLEIVDVLDV
jgi:hypothetical protein